MNLEKAVDRLLPLETSYECSLFNIRPPSPLGRVRYTLEGAVFDGSGKAQKPGIVNYAGLLQRGQGLQKQCPQACPTAFSRITLHCP
jgi:hypothetical protein